MIRRSIAELDNQVPIYDVRTLHSLAEQRLGLRRFALSLFGVFAGLALLLGAVGVYGVMSFGIAQRSNEFGIRLALGADKPRLLRMVLTDGLRMTIPGVLLGLALALGLGRLLGGLLYEVSPLDPLTYGVGALLLLGVCILASFVPARRATGTDPMVSMRAQ